MQTDAPVAIQTVPLWIDNAPDDGVSTFEVRDPGRPQDVVARVAAADAALLDRAVDAAERGGREWASRSLEERIDVLRRAVDELLPRAPEWAQALARENGALLSEARLDVERGLGVVASTLDYADPYLRTTVEEKPTHTLRIEKVPVGVVACIVPWNSPMVLALAKVGPALVSGNSVLVKPSTEAPVVLSELLIELARLLPAGVLNVLNGSGLGDLLTSHPRIQKISFTGSTEVGREVMRGAAGNIKRLDLELGGNDAAILLEDVDLDEVIDSLCKGVFTRAGQICFAVKRIYAPRSRFEEVHEAIRKTVGKYRVGHGLDERSDFGPVITSRQVDKLQGLIDRARAGGATIEVLGSPVDDDDFAAGAYMLPTLVTGISHDSELVAVEQFGPVVPLVPYDSIDDAIRMANDSVFGLASSVWGADVARAVQVASRIEAGVTFINGHKLWSLSFDVPLGGVKQSGIGRERTALGIQEYVEEHAIRIPVAG